MFNYTYSNQRTFFPNLSVPPPPPPPPPPSTVMTSPQGMFFSSLPPQHSFFPPPLSHVNPSFFTPPVPLFGSSPFVTQQNVNNLLSKNLNLGTAPGSNALLNVPISGQTAQSSNKSPNKYNEYEEKRHQRRREERKKRREGSVSITEELHVDSTELNKRTSTLDCIESAENSPDSKKSKSSGTSEESSESIQLVPSDDPESDGEHPEMGRNWRIKMLFSGRLDLVDLPPNCERPQTDEGRSFPAHHTKLRFRTQDYDEQRQAGHSSRMEVQEMMSERQSTSNDIQTTNNRGTGYAYTSRSSRVWISNDLANKRNLFNGVDATRRPPPTQMPNVNTSTKTTTNVAPVPNILDPTTPIVANNPTRAAITPCSSPRNEVPTQSSNNSNKKRFQNRSLVIFKNGKRAYVGSKQCFQFLETGECLSGVFCDFEHNGSVEHMSKKFCGRLLRGLCRNTDDSCPYGSHSTLLPHQMPICDFYLKMSCSRGKEACPYLHVKHTDGMEKCEEFNKGCCQRGVMCNAPHQYRYHRIKEKKQMEQAPNRHLRSGRLETGSITPQFSNAPQNLTNEQCHNPITTNKSSSSNNDTLQWFT